MTRPAGEVQRDQGGALGLSQICNQEVSIITTATTLFAAICRFGS